MRSRSFIWKLVMFCIVFRSLHGTNLWALASPVSRTDSPAERLLRNWATAYNTGKLAAVRQFHAEHFTQSPGSTSVDAGSTADLRLFTNDGPYTIQTISTPSSDSATAVLHGAETGYWMEITISVAKDDTERIARFGYRHIETPDSLLPHERLTEEQIRSKTDALITKLVSNDVFSGTILIAKDGRPIYMRACGFANRAWNEPARIDTRFNVASINKMLTAVAVAQLVEQGKLSYQDSVASVLPNYRNVDAARKITIGQLLTHTSGLGNRSFGEFRKGYRTLQPYLQSFDNEPLEFEAGTKFSYSNDGYLLLGLIVEKVSQQNFDDYLRDHIYRPAGMTNSGNYELDSDPANLAEGYMDKRDGGRRSNIFTLPVKGLPFGLGYSTVEDMLRFDTALRRNTLITAESLTMMWLPKTEDTGSDGKYGYGFFIREYNGTRIIGHGGGWAGVTTQMDMYPDLGYTVVILTNYDDSTRPIAYKIQEWLTEGMR